MSIATDLQTIANNVPLVYNAGYEAGAAQGGGGSDSFYDTFWDAYQYNGNRNNYEYAFAGALNTTIITGWTDDNFKPKFPIKPTRAQNMFYSSKIQKSPYLKIIDFSSCQAFTQCFYSSEIEELGVVDCGACVAGFPMTNVFAGCKNLHSIEKFIPPRSTAAFNTTFGGCTALVNITVEGTFLVTVSFGDSALLNKSSLTSIGNALSNTVTGKTLTLSLAAVNKAFETSVGANDGSTSAEWLALVATKPNWTIAYV